MPADTISRSVFDPINWGRLERAILQLNNPSVQAESLSITLGNGIIAEKFMHKAGATIERSAEVVLEFEKVLKLQDQIQTITWEEFSTILLHLSCVMLFTASDLGQFKAMLILLQNQNDIAMMAGTALERGEDLTQPDPSHPDRNPS